MAYITKNKRLPPEAFGNQYNEMFPVLLDETVQMHESMKN